MDVEFLQERSFNEHVEDVRQVLQDFLAPELREIRTRLDAMDRRLDIVESANDVRYHALTQRVESVSQSLSQRLDSIENANGVRYQAIVQRLEQIQQSFAFDKRISTLEAEKTRSA